jgi:hypothetical protein
MKKYIFLAVLFLVGVALLHAQPTHEVNFRWDANTEPDLAGYRIYRSTVSGVYGTVPVFEVLCRANDITCCEGRDVIVGPDTYYWVARAFDDEGYESENSVEQSLIWQWGMPPPRELRAL